LELLRDWCHAKKAARRAEQVAVTKTRLYVQEHREYQSATVRLHDAKRKLSAAQNSSDAEKADAEKAVAEKAVAEAQAKRRRAYQHNAHALGVVADVNRWLLEFGVAQHPRFDDDAAAWYGEVDEDESEGRGEE
jgi:hypothetical protein